jgi:lipopolysaccharide export system permease protein
MSQERHVPGRVVAGYLLREFAGYLLPIVSAFIVLYLIIDFFDRLNILLRYHAAAGAALRYFLFKVPLILTQIIGPAVLAAMLLSLGMLSRHNEITALRASGVSLAQTALPLLLAAALISIATVVWNETVVPYCTRTFQYVNNVEIRKRQQRALLSDRGIWYRGGAGFYSIDHIDPRRSSLFGVRIYQTTPSFQLARILEIPWLRWTGRGWDTGPISERTVGPDGTVVTRSLPPDGAIIPETLSDFLEVRRDPDELSFLALRARIADLSAKGIDASNYLVDLHLKLAVPFTSLVLAALAVPLAGRVQRHPSIARIVGAGLAIGFAYWVVLGLTRSLGESGVLPAPVAAWAANGLFALVSCALFLSHE